MSARRVITMRFEVDQPDNDAGGETALVRLAQYMEAGAILSARSFGGVVRDRRLFVDRRGEQREIATVGLE